MSKITRKQFFAWIAGAVGLAGYVAARSSAPSSGLLVIEFDPMKFPHGKDGAYHAGVVAAVDRIANSRRILQVAGHCIFPVYGRNGSPTFMAMMMLVPNGFHPNDESFENFPKVRWLGGDKFEPVNSPS